MLGFRGNRALILPSHLNFVELLERLIFPNPAALFQRVRLRGQLCFGLAELCVETLHCRFLRGRWQRQLRAPGRRAAIRNESGLFDVGEEGLERVKILGLDRVKAMVVTFRATHCGAEPYRTHRAYAIAAVLGEILGRLQAAFGRSASHAVIRRCNFLVERCIRDEVAGQLLARELIERLILAKRAQHVIAIGPRGQRVVAVKSRGVAVADGVEPVHGLLFGVRRRRQQTVHNFFVRARRVVGDERREFCGSRRQSRKVEAHATRSSVRLSAMPAMA